MAVFGPNPTDGENATVVYGQIMHDIKKRIYDILKTMESNESPDNGFMSCILALLALSEACPKNANLTIYKGQVKEWEDAYLEWLSRVLPRIPAKIRDDLRQTSIAHLDQLQGLGSDMPKDMWF